MVCNSRFVHHHNEEPELVPLNIRVKVNANPASVSVCDQEIGGVIGENFICAKVFSFHWLFKL